MEIQKGIKEILYRFYNIKIGSIHQIKGGWSAFAFVLADNCHRKYLLKVYNKSKSSTLKLTSLIDEYMPVVAWLNKNTNLVNRIVNPLTTDRGGYKYEDEIYIYIWC